MSSVVNFAEYLKNVIQAGQSIEGNVVKIVADNGTEIGDAVFKVVQGGNGTASDVGVAVKVGASGATTTGLAYMALDVGVVGEAIAPALGLIAGVGIYAISDYTWNNIKQILLENGQTVGGKVIGYWNGANVNFSAETIEIFKDALLNAGMFAPTYEVPDYETSGRVTITSRIDPTELLAYALANVSRNYDLTNVYGAISNFISTYYTSNKICLINVKADNTDHGAGWSPITIWITEQDLTEIVLGAGYYCRELEMEADSYTAGGTIIMTGRTRERRRLQIVWEGSTIISETMRASSINSTSTPSQNVQPGATIPSIIDFWLSYPDWVPWDYPLPDPGELPTVYPVKYPGTEPDPYPDQEGAQDPEEEPAPEIVPIIGPGFIIPTPKPDPWPEEETEEDPDEEDEEDEIDDDEERPEEPDPIDPNPPKPRPGTPIVIPPFPDSVSSSKLFTVYNPTSAQLNALGAYLWDSSIMASIRDIWQNPLDGIISLIQVYATPTVSGSHNIILGFLDSEVSSAVVGSQFVTIDCGTVTVPEDKENATDYAPYTSLHLYLPFIGIVELDTNECMNSSINVKYKVDVYTGTCLATVSVTRQIDMPHSPILYTYSGNCSQQIPLTSGNATGILTALIGGITAGLGVASGGGLSVLAGASIAGQSLTHEMFHVNHSGNISANAGIMGQKKPYLIIGRRHCYDANNYSAIYGFPANTTVILGNHTGYVKVKKCFLNTSATQPEHDKIMELLTNGIIL